MKLYLFLFIIYATLFNGCGNNSRDLPYVTPEDTTIYEDAEDGSTQRWEIIEGFDVENVDIGANGSERSILVKQNWLVDENNNYIHDDNGFAINEAYYQLQINNDNQFVLHFDKMKIDNADRKYCFTVGARVATDYGIRYISFNTFYDRLKMDPDSIELDDGSKEFTFPLSMSYVNDTNVWRHIRLDLPKYLHKFEPNNNIQSVETFYFQGGNDYLDNIYFTTK